MADDSFAQIAARLDYPMIVVTTAHGDERGGCLLGFHTQCSIDPPRYAVWISKVNHTARVAVHADTFAVHFLDDSDSGRELAKVFGTLTDDAVDKFARCAWHPGPNGVPLLDACPTRIIAGRHSLFDDGCDHVAIVLEPAESQMPAPLNPLMFSAVRDLDAGHDAS